MNNRVNPEELVKMMKPELPDQNEECVLIEDLALLVERKLTAEKRDKVLRHISACDRCYNAFLLLSDIQMRDRESFLMRIPIRAVAATVLVFFFSLYLFFRLNTGSFKSKEDILPTTSISGRKSDMKKKVVLKNEESKKNLILKRVRKTAIKNKRDLSVHSKKRRITGELKKKTDLSERDNPLLKISVGNVSLMNEDKAIEMPVPKQESLEKSIKVQKRMKKNPYKVALNFPVIKKCVDILIKNSSKRNNLLNGEVIVFFSIDNKGDVLNVIFEKVDRDIKDIIERSLLLWKFCINSNSILQFKMELSYSPNGKWLLKKYLR